MTPAEEQAIRDRAAAWEPRCQATLTWPDGVSQQCIARRLHHRLAEPGDWDHDYTFDLYSALDTSPEADRARLLAEVDRLREERGYLEEQLRQCREGPWA